jgi:hypothetical protein
MVLRCILRSFKGRCCKPSIIVRHFLPDRCCNRRCTSSTMVAFWSECATTNPLSGIMFISFKKINPSTNDRPFERSLTPSLTPPLAPPTKDALTMHVVDDKPSIRLCPLFVNLSKTNKRTCKDYRKKKLAPS